MRRGLVLLIAALVAVFGCAAAGADPSVADSETLNGTVTLRQPAVLPPDTLLTVTLEDVSLADAAAVTIAQTQIQLKDLQAPIAFSLVYPSAAVKPGAVYAARARLNLRDQLLFTTTERYQVDALNPTPLQLVMDPVPTTPPPTPDVSLTDTYWKLLSVAGQPVVVADQMREPQLVLNGQDGRFAGSGGVNRLMGGYTVDGTMLTFSQVASTMMAGPPEAMTQEQVIVAALGNVRGFGITGDRLTLVDQAGQPVITAVAVALR